MLASITELIELGASYRKLWKNKKSVKLNLMLKRRRRAIKTNLKKLIFPKSSKMLKKRKRASQLKPLDYSDLVVL